MPIMMVPLIRLDETGRRVRYAPSFTANKSATNMPSTPEMRIMSHLGDEEARAASVKFDADPISMRKHIAKVRMKSSIILRNPS